MNSGAIYTVIDKGRESYFLSNIAGGYSYPFYIFNYANRMARTINENYPMGEVSAAEIFPLMKANHNFPENVQGERLFRPIEDNIAARKLDEFRDHDDIPFGITLDYDKQKIGFVFNKNCPEIKLNDMEINLLSKSIRSVFEERDFHVDTKLSESENEELFYKNALEKAAGKIQDLKNPVIEIALVNDRYTTKMQLPADTADMKKAERRLEISCLDGCEISKIKVKNNALGFIQKCSGLNFSALNNIAKWTNSMLEKGGSNQLDKLAAVAEAYSISHIDDAVTAIENIDYFDCVPAQDEEEYAHYVLYESDRSDIHNNFAKEVENYIDYYHLGKDLADANNVHFTSRGCVVDSREYSQEEAINMSM